MSSVDPRERDDLCGRRLVAEWDSEDLTEKYDPDTWYETEDGTHYCCREVWDGADDGRCIWHADVANKPADELVAALSHEPERLDRAVLRGVEFPESVEFSGCHLQAADFEGADLFGSFFDGADLQRAYLSGANLSGVIFSDANLRMAYLSGANLWSADFDDAILRDAHLANGNLHWTNLAGATLEGADLTGCRLRNTIFKDATFDESTTFGSISGYEIEADEQAKVDSWLASRVSTRFRALGRQAIDPEPLELAATQYRTVQRLRREHDLKQDPALEIQEKHARRKRALAERRYWDWFKLAIYRWPMGYGEKPWHVVGTSLAVILASALLYPLAGIRVDGAERTYPAVLADPAGTAVETVRVVAESVYFSTVTFTTLGYGDVEPVGWAKALSTVESFVGALLMALLVFVLGRRATW